MLCSGCRQDNPDDSRFCLQCGNPLGLRCGDCGAELPTGSRFCNQCGATLATSEPAPTSLDRAPRDYTPKHLAEKILNQKSAVEGERKQVTVLFADVKSSMDMQEGIDPEEWHRIMDRFFQILADSVHRFEGTVNQYTGDGIMALFGAPIAHEDHAQRACYAALHLTEALREYARELRRERGLDFSTRMGINSGEVVVGKIGDDLRMDYTAQGQTVGLASRMEALAEPGKVYLTSHTADRVKGYFELEDLGAFNVKGVNDPVPVFELIAVGSLRTRFDVSRARGLTRFVGRDADMTLLEAALESARNGKGRAVGIVANAGVGKSRLCFEFSERCRAAGINVLQASGVAHGKNIPLLPILEIFRGYFGIDERDDPLAAREKVAGRLLLIDESFRDQLPLVFDFLGIPDPQRPPPPMDADGRQRRLVTVVRRLIERANPAGFVILIEDLHWVDDASDAFVAEYVDAISGGPGLLLLNFRPEYRADWMNKTWYQQLPLEPLGPAAIRDLLNDLLGNDPSVAGLADRIHERTQGNPYFTEEIVRSMVESGALEGTRGSYRLTSPVESLAVPYSVHAVLSARIDRLPEREKQVLQTAAAIGKEFSEPILASVASLPAAQLSEAIASLTNAEFVHQRSLYPIAEYEFAHPLTQEVAISSQLQEQRCGTHAAIARAIQEHEPNRIDENASLVAHHYEQAEEPLEAARFHARAAAWTGTKDLGATLRHWQRVRELVRGIPDEEEALNLRLAACVQILVMGGFRMGLSEAAVDELYEEGKLLADNSGNATLVTLLGSAYGARLVGLGRVREYYEHAQNVLEVAEAVEVPVVRCMAKIGVIYSAFLVGRMQESFALIAEGEEIVGEDIEMGRQEMGFSYRIFMAQNRAGLLSILGKLTESRSAYERALRIARESGFHENIGWTLGNLPVFGLYTGETSFDDLGDIKAAAHEALRIAEEMGSGFSRAHALSAVGLAHLLTDNPGEAVRFFTDALDLSRSQRIGLEAEPVSLANLSRGLVGTGDCEKALATAEEAVALASERGQRFWEVHAQLALASALGEHAGAKAHARIESALQRAGALVESTGARVCEPTVAEARARLATIVDDPDAVERHLREAHRLFESVGATGHARRIATELGI